MLDKHQLADCEALADPSLPRVNNYGHHPHENEPGLKSWRPDDQPQPQTHLKVAQSCVTPRAQADQIFRRQAP